MIIVISMRKINESVIKNNKFITIKIAFENLNKKHSIKNVITMKLHVINDFNVNLLIKNNVLISKNIIVNLNHVTIVFQICLRNV